MKLPAILLVSIVALSSIAVAQPCLVQPLDLDDRLRAADAVVLGTVIASHGTWDDAQRSIYTVHAIQVWSAWSNHSVPADTLWIFTEGGTVDGMGRITEGALALQPGAAGYFLLESLPRGPQFTRVDVRTVYRVYADQQGFLRPSTQGVLVDHVATSVSSAHILEERIARMQSREYRMVMPERRASFVDELAARDRRSKHEVEPRIHAGITFTPTEIIGGATDLLTINGSGFGSERGSSYVTMKANDADYHTADVARSFQYDVWTDTRIVVRMPNAYSGPLRAVINGEPYQSADSLRVKANIATRSIQPLDYNHLINKNGDGGYTWYLTDELFGNIEARSTVSTLLQQMQCDMGVNFVLAGEATSQGYQLGDNVNVITFDEDQYRLPAGVVGYCDWIWMSCILGGQTFYWVGDHDVRLSRNFPWYDGFGTPPGNAAKLWYVLAHEIGHAAQLGHVNEWGETMHPIVHNLPASEWLSRDTLTQWDRRAGQYTTSLAQNFTFRGCGVLPMLAVPGDPCPADPVSVNETSVASLSVAPNPAMDGVTVTLNQPVPTALMAFVYDQDGRLVQIVPVADATQQVQIVTSSMPVGTYTLALGDSGRWGIVRFVVMR